MSESKHLKTENICIRCTSQEKELIQKQAAEMGISLGAYIIEKCLKSNRRTELIGFCKMQTLLNKLKAKEIHKKEFIVCADTILKEMKWQ